MKHLFFLFFVTTHLTSFCQNENQNLSLNIQKSIPNWALNLISINYGTYDDYLKKDNPDENIIGFLSWGDQKLNIATPYSKFFYIKINGKEHFLKFNSTKKEGVRFTHAFENDQIKIELSFDGVKNNKSGVGDGGKFHLYYQGKKIHSLNFWSA